MSHVVGNNFDEWIRRNTWDSGNRTDLENFYRFVKAVVRYSKHDPTSGELEAEILKKWRSKRTRRALGAAMDHYLNLYSHLLAYSRTRDFPNALVERSDIAMYWYRLTDNHHSDDANSVHMARVWGSDWKRKFNENDRKIAMRSMKPARV